MPRVFASHARARPLHAGPERRRRLRRDRRARAGARSTGRPLLRTHTFGGTRSTTSTSMPEDPPRTTARRWSSSTGSAASGRTGSRTSRAAARAAHGGARPSRVRALPHAAREDHDLGLRPRWSRRCATTSASARCAVVGNSMGGFIGAEVAIRFPRARRAARARVRRRASPQRPYRAPVLRSARARRPC